MADSISNYTFDFEYEVNELMRSLGKTADVLCFMNVDAVWPEDGKKPPSVSIPQLIAGKLYSDKLIAAYKEFVIAYYSDDAHKHAGSLCKSFADEKTFLNSVVCIRENNLNEDMYGVNGLEDLMLLSILYHETGHALAHLGTPPPDEEQVPAVKRANVTYGECIADAYAALRLLQRFGAEAKPFIYIQGWIRAHSFLMGHDDEHMTSTVTDKIIFDSQHQDFSKLAIEDVLQKAIEYANQYAPGTYELSEAWSYPIKDYKRYAEYRTGRNHIASSSVSRHDIAFYVAARDAMPALYPDMSPDPLGSHDFATASHLKSLAATIEFSAIFNEASAVPGIPSPTIADIITPPMPSPVRHPPAGHRP